MKSLAFIDQWMDNIQRSKQQARTFGLLCFFMSFHLSVNAQAPDFGHMLPPEDVTSPVFQLQQHYPKQQPEVDPELKKLFSINVKQAPKEYLDQLFVYVYERYLKTNEAKTNVEGFVVDVPFSNTADPQWFHAPWLHWGAEGREGFSGLVRQQRIPAGHLADTQRDETSAYSLSLYNPVAAWVLGQVWVPGMPPKLDYFQQRSGFPVGSVMIKTLWVPLNQKQVPALENPLQRRAFLAAEDLPGIKASYPGQRLESQVSLLEVAVMVRDPRVNDSSGWVFANFQYDGRNVRQPSWHHLKPVGLMWGNDPNQSMAVEPNSGRSSSLTQTYLVPRDERPLVRSGWGGRLSSATYHEDTSCQSCHSTAQYPELASQTPLLDTPVGTEAAPIAWMKWFRNYPRGIAFDQGSAIPLDYSMGVLHGFQNYMAFADLYLQGRYAAQYPNRFMQRRTAVEADSVVREKQESSELSNEKIFGDIKAEDWSYFVEQPQQESDGHVPVGEKALSDELAIENHPVEADIEVDRANDVDASEETPSLSEQDAMEVESEEEPRSTSKEDSANLMPDTTKDQREPGFIWQALKARLQQGSDSPVEHESQQSEDNQQDSSETDGALHSLPGPR